MQLKLLYYNGLVSVGGCPLGCWIQYLSVESTLQIPQEIRGYVCQIQFLYHLSVNTHFQGLQSVFLFLTGLRFQKKCDYLLQNRLWKEFPIQENQLDMKKKLLESSRCLHLIAIVNGVGRNKNWGLTKKPFIHFLIFFYRRHEEGTF